MLLKTYKTTLCSRHLTRQGKIALRAGRANAPFNAALGDILKIAILYILVLFSVVSCSSNPSSNAYPESQEVPRQFLGSWTISVKNLQREVVTTLVVRFSKEQADSCIGGYWRKLEVLSHSTTNEDFFPIGEPLSYEIMDNKVVIGRNEICDAYLHLNGEMKNSRVTGEYIAFGWGSENLGYFSLERDSK